uniref:SCAN box domain-containing protein n=1 Tax=Crocodylus porosus TaxID=8502 RepID=A0A7M4FFH6_CROPO
ILTFESKYTGSIIKEEILQRLNITPERHCQAFRGRKRKEERVPRLLWQNLTDLLNKWLKPETATKEDVCDQILLEQCITNLEEDAQRWVRCQCPKSSHEALQLAEDFDMAQGETHRDRGMRGVSYMWEAD